MDEREDKSSNSFLIKNIEKKDQEVKGLIDTLGKEKASPTRDELILELKSELLFGTGREKNHGKEKIPDCRCRADGMSFDDQGRTALRFRRHSGDDAAADDVYARPQIYAAFNPRGRLALPRHVADGEPRAQTGFD